MGNGRVDGPRFSGAEEESAEGEEEGRRRARWDMGAVWGKERGESRGEGEWEGEERGRSESRMRIWSVLLEMLSI